MIEGILWVLFIAGCLLICAVILLQEVEVGRVGDPSVRVRFGGRFVAHGGLYMTEDRPKIRLFVDAPLGPGETLVLTEQAHYLTGVMRQAAGAEIALFTSSDGE